MNVLGIIPARGGSKGIIRKNMQILGGKPLLQWTVEVAISAKKINRIVLSTDDYDIAEFGRLLGIEVPFLRPKELAQDDTPMIPVVQHVVRNLESENSKYDAVFLLQPTSPFRKKEDIDGAVELLENSDAHSVISFVDVGEKHPARMKYISNEGLIIDPPFGEDVEGKRRQDLNKVYIRDGSIYLTRRDIIMANNSFKGDKCLAWIIPNERACNIDSPFDLFMAEQMIEHGYIKNA